jgi:uncharacterized SAM-binding protein YcdF (DUF218 family)
MQKRPSKFVNALFLIAALACYAYYLANGIFVRFGQSMLWLWPVAGTALLIRFVIVSWMIHTGNPSPIPKGMLRLLRAVVLIGLILFLAGEGVILTGAFEKAPADMDYIVVLGAKVNGTEPSGALRNRIEVASEYLKGNPSTIAIASGGQGEDEGISEAQCIYEGLVERGVSPERIVLEDKSTTTVENLVNSFSLIGEKEATVGVVTNDFHVFRALRIARKYGDYAFYGVPVATTLISFPHYMMREFLAVISDALKGNLAF